MIECTSSAQPDEGIMVECYHYHKIASHDIDAAGARIFSPFWVDKDVLVCFHCYCELCKLLKYQVLILEWYDVLALYRRTATFPTVPGPGTTRSIQLLM